MTSKYIAALALVLLIAAGCSSKDNTSEQQQNQTESQQNASEEDKVATNTEVEVNTETPAAGTFSDEDDIAPVAQPEVVEIKMTANGFSPSTVTIQKGDYVQFTNEDSAPHWPASGPHPTHTNLPSFDAKKGIEPGQNYRYQFTSTGSFGFHDHLNSSMFGKVIVE